MGGSFNRGNIFTLTLVNYGVRVELKGGDSYEENGKKDLYFLSLSCRRIWLVVHPR